VSPVAYLTSSLRSRETRSRRRIPILGLLSIATKLRTRTLDSSSFDGEGEKLSITFLGSEAGVFYFMYVYVKKVNSVSYFQELLNIAILISALTVLIFASAEKQRVKA
jgi:hypothetical protein